MVKLLLAVMLTILPYGGFQLPLTIQDWQSGQTTLPYEARVMRYNHGVFLRVIPNRIRWNQITDCGDCIGYAALPRKGDIDRTVCIEYNNNTYGPLHVVDVAAWHHMNLLRTRGWGIDIDYNTFFSIVEKDRPFIAKIKECNVDVGTDSRYEQ